MKCLKCNGKTDVTDSRYRTDGTKRRRHKCRTKGCEYKFTTSEIPIAISDNSIELNEWFLDAMLVELGIREPEPEEE
jgi:hypothetical protein